MTQGRKLEVAGIWDNIVVELQAVAQVLRPHDVREVAALNWEGRAMAVLLPLVEAHGSPMDQKLMRALIVNNREMQRANVIEDLEHESVFSVAQAAG